MTRRSDDTVTPRRGMVALPALAAGVGLALSLPPLGFWILAFPAAGLLWWRLGGLPSAHPAVGRLAGRARLLRAGPHVGPRLHPARGRSCSSRSRRASWRVACLVVPPGPVAARALAFPAAMTLAEAVRMTWPFGGLPLGGVFLGQADGPVLGVGPARRTPRPDRRRLHRRCRCRRPRRRRPPAPRRDAARVRSFARADLGGPGWWPAGTEAADRVGTLTGALAGTGTLVATGVVALVLVALPRDGRATTRPTAGRRSARSPRRPCRAAVPAASQVRRSTRHRCWPPRWRRRADSRRSTAVTSPRLVLWPEDVVSLDEPLSQSPEESVLSATGADASHTTLVVGVTETVSSTAFRNEVVAWGPDGTLVARFEKVHRVPFGEYVPYRSFFAHLGNLSAVPLDAVPGTGTGLHARPRPAPLGAMVSYEVFYADRGRASVRAGAELLIVPTNTSSYATAQVPTQEIAAGEIQAVQQGRDLLQAAPTGFSAAITNRGAARRALGARRPPGGARRPSTGGSGLTLYVRFGDLPVLARRRWWPSLAGWWLADASPWRPRVDVGRVAVIRATRSSPSGCRRRESPRRGTWRSCSGSSSNARRSSKPYARSSSTVSRLNQVTCE